ncbi:MAG: galactose-1-epimerase, partial [Parasporobacterium sp.]|nr:galactose-1-epimerase [Parasporobacterium sp.]
MITDRFFGTTCDGLQVHEYTLTNASGAAVSILDYGCTVREILMPDKAGALTDVALGYDTVAEYETGTGYLGAAIGRYANR